MKTRPPSPDNLSVDLALLEEKRHAMRHQALEHLAEADRLDALYAAVTGEKTTATATLSTPKTDMGEF